MKFNDWLSMYQVMKTEDPKNTTKPIDFYIALQRRIITELAKVKKVDPMHSGSTEAIAYNQSSVELSWFQQTQPYYKIYRPIVRMLLDTDVDIPSSLLHSPLKTILLCLPEDHGIEELTAAPGNELRSILMEEVAPNEQLRMSEELSNTAPNTRRFIFWTDWGESDDETWAHGRVPVVAFQILGIDDENASIDQHLQTWLGYKRVDWDRGLHISDEMLLASIRLAIGICLLATNADKVLEADVLNKHVARYRESDDPIFRDELHRRAKKLGKNGWLLGREIALPDMSPGQTGEPSGEGGEELTRSHLRRGHFHKVLHGPKKSLTKVAWYRPIVVRPDLPASEANRGYHTKL